ncbi:spore gernimation protein [Bacillus sp. FJAT-18017]|uniref:spore germination protein n=1 Tax=Bacillus sp. FJAT-18017 TaxID=1705566 RepID=UPI0006AE3302|nr:spore germination protein [Bacillus sp. FJAT-18017]ALC91214.1 spore gernimation protein [Bacillus sp. FJAT-18017]
MNILKLLAAKTPKNKQQTPKNSAKQNEPIASFSIGELGKAINESFGNSVDMRAISGEIFGSKGYIFYLESMIDQKTLKRTTANLFAAKNDGSVPGARGFISFCKEIFGGIRHTVIETKEEIISAMLTGSVVIVLDGLAQGISVMMPSQEKRAVEEPTAQTIIRGPREGFVETLSVNVNLIRKRIRNERLYFENFIVGEDTKTNVYIAYMKGIANDSIVDEVRQRIKRIKTSAIFESGNVEEMIVDKTATIFPLAMNTERADTAAANIMEGKIVILVDGSPFCLIVPAVFVNFFEISEDYYQSFILGSFLRFIRYLSFMLALLTPSVYVGVLSFHHELLPTTLLLSIVSQREGVPFPAVVEVLLMEITFEILREAGIRTPKMIGQMVSIVGALVIGQAAAEAGIISNAMIIVVAITAIANFASPVYNFAAAARLMRFLLIIAASILGLYGVLLLLVVMVAHLCSLRSFGIPYLSPVAPFIVEDQKDVFVRFPWWGMKNRPKFLLTEESSKTTAEGSPSPPSMNGGNDRE